MKNKIISLFCVLILALVVAALTKTENLAAKSTSAGKPSAATIATQPPATDIQQSTVAETTQTLETTNTPQSTTAKMPQPSATDITNPTVAEPSQPSADTTLSADKAAETPNLDTKANGLFADPVVARGKNFEIKRSHIDEAFISAKAAAAANGVIFTEADRPLLEGRIMNELIFSKVLSAKATAADKTKAAEAADKFIADARKQFISENAFNARLKAGKMTLDGLRQKLVSDAIPSVVLERELRAQINVTDAQIKQFYMDNPSKFEQPEMARVAHILISTRDDTGLELSEDQKDVKRKQIEALLKRAKDGEDFGKLAKQFSEDPASKDNGGELAPFPRGQSQMLPVEFESAAFSLKTNEISGVVTTRYGYHVIKKLEKLPPRVVPLGEATTRIKEFLISQEAAKLAPGYFEKLKQEAGVEILDEALKAADKKLKEQVNQDKAATK
jgi:parvulin-like peptidyl-prolyl isomerase